MVDIPGSAQLAQKEHSGPGGLFENIVEGWCRLVQAHGAPHTWLHSQGELLTKVNLGQQILNDRWLWVERREGFDSSVIDRNFSREQALQFYILPSLETQSFPDRKSPLRALKCTKTNVVFDDFLNVCMPLPVKRTKCSAFFVRVSWCEQLPKRDKFGRAECMNH